MNQLLSESLTDSDIRELTDNAITVCTYSELIDNGVLNTLLNSPSNACIFLLRASENYGHWLLIWLKTEGKEKGIYVYDPYGYDVENDIYKKNVSEELLLDLHQDKPYLLKELYDSGFRIYFNEYKHQKDNKDIATCGKHCVIRSHFLEMDTDDYDKMITKGKLTPDEKVVLLTME